MPPIVATIVYYCGIAGLFWLDRDLESRPSKALWLPVMWLFITSSRPITQWLHLAPPMTSTEQYLDGSPIDRAVFTALLFAGLIALFIRGRRVVHFLSGNIPIVMFFGYCAVSVVWSDYPDVSFKRWTKALGDLVMVAIVLTDSEPTVAFKRLLSRLGFLLLPLSVLFIKYYPDLGRTYDPDLGHWQLMYTGVTTNKNSLGGITFMLGIGALWQFIHWFRAKEDPSRRRHLLAQGVLVVVVIRLLFEAQSVTSSACFVLAAVVMAMTIVSSFFRKPAIIHSFVFGTISFAVFALLIAPNMGLIESLGRNPNLTGRTQIWKFVLAMPVNRIFGTGFESFWLGRRLQQMWGIYWWHPNEAHNGYIEVLLNLGWIGVVLLAILMIVGYRTIISTLRSDPELASLKVAYFLVIALYNFTEAGFRMLTITWIFLLLVTVRVVDVPVVGPLPVIPNRVNQREREPEFAHGIYAGPRREFI